MSLNEKCKFHYLGRSFGYLAFFASMGLVLIMCDQKSDDHSTVTPDVNAETASGELCIEIAKVMCYNLFECCTGQQIEETLGIEITTDESDCRHDIELICLDDLSYIFWALGQGNASLDAEQANLCLEALLVGEEGCFPFTLGHPAYEAACPESIVQGTQGEGGACLTDLECQQDMYCAANRKCESLPKAGEECSFDSGCVSGYFCGADEMGDFICQAYKQMGEACSYAFPMALCAPELYCEFTDEYLDEGVCKNMKTIGEACADDMPCLDGICLSGNCADGRECSDDSDCGGACENSGGYCEDDTDCDGTCADGGGWCDEDSDCGGTCAISGYYCNDDWDCHDSGTCASSGYYCYDEWDCAYEGLCSESGYTCYEGGYECLEDEECIPLEECIPNDSDSCELGTCEMEACVGASVCSGRICAEWYGVVDYCELGLGAIDFFDDDDDIY
jgi:hypothetical protein